MAGRKNADGGRRLGLAIGVLGLVAVTVAAPTTASATVEIGAEQFPNGGITFSNPVHVAQPPNDSRRVFIVEQPGRIRLVKSGAFLPRPFLDIRSAVGLEATAQGLFSVAFPRNYGDGNGTTTRRFYVYFTNNEGDIRIKEYKRTRSSGDLASPTYSRTVLAIPHGEGTDHYGGQLQFGPDGYLYAATGDGGSESGPDPPNNAQNPRSLLGKLLRIDPRSSGSASHTNPPGNPFAGPSPGADEIFSMGLRNPWRFSFDDEMLALTDVGQDKFEEVNLLSRKDANGANFGWSGFEGPAVFIQERTPPEHTAPQYWYCHAGTEDDLCDGRPTGCSITGGHVVRDARLGLAGRYAYGDFCSGELRSFDPADPSGTDASLGITLLQRPVSFGTDNANRVYVATRSTNPTSPVYRLTSSGEAEGWLPLASSPAPARTEVGAARIGEHIYVVGGASQPGAVASNEVRRYDIEDDSWKVLAPMPQAVHHPGVTAYRGRLYVHGGYTADNALQGATGALQRFNPEKNLWKLRTPTRRPRAAHTLQALNGKLYSIGGVRQGNQPPLASMSIYDIATDAWKSGPSMPTAREHLAGVIVDGRIFVAGGRRINAATNLTSFERFSPELGTWKRLPDLLVARSGIAAAPVGDRIVVFGGERQNPNSTIDEVEVYDRSTREWSFLPNMDPGRHGLGGASFGSRVFAIEGGQNFGFTYSNLNEYLDVQ